MNFDKLIQRLEEGTSPLRRLYHYTDLVKIAKIVSQNKFELTFAKGADAGKDKNFKRNFYLSCSTIARGRYGTGSEGRYYGENFQALIELDASKISDNYKIIPVDYWSWPEQDRSDKSRIDETEDRIVARNPSIPNAKKYIIAVHVFIPKPKEKESEWDITRKKSYTEAINRIAHSGVDYYLYDDIRYFTLLRREKAHKLESDTHQYELRHDYPGDREDYYAREAKRLSDAVDWLIDPTANIDEKNRERFERQWNWRDLYSTIDSDIHSDKSNFRPEIRKSIHKLSEYQRKYNKSLQDIVKDAFERSRERY
jgi:hypothetical protein